MIIFQEQPPFKLRYIFQIMKSFCQKQPQKYINIDFENIGFSFSSKCDNSIIKVGINLRAHFFSSYLFQKSINALIPVHKLCKILSLPDETDTSIVFTIEQPAKQLKVRIYSAKTDQKSQVNLQLVKQFGQMISEKYEQPLNPLLNIQNINSILYNSENMNICSFTMSVLEYKRICKQFVLVADKISINYQRQAQSNKKYLVFSAPTLNGIKSITLNQEISQQQMTMVMSIEKMSITQVFLVADLHKIANVCQNQFIFQQNFTIYMHRNVGITALYKLKNNQGEIGLELPTLMSSNS